MEHLEKVVGNILATILIALFLWSTLFTLFNLMFRDGKGSGAYGSRGNYYMTE